jgi:adenosylcobinamide kinase/adenosylcobinamide-phosphate guanylyltransferase
VPPDADSPDAGPGEPARTGPALVVGSAAAPWPVAGCGCVACRNGTARAATALRLDDVLLQAGAVTTSRERRPLRPGERFASGGVRLAALPGPAPGPPAVVAGWHEPTPRTLLWAEGPGDLPAETMDALTGAGLDAVALDLRGEDGRPDPRRLAHALARLRAVDAVAPGADVVALGLTHDLHPATLTGRLALWGARVAVDGTPMPASAAPGHGPGGPPARTLVLGPASSGKSDVAEDLLAAEPAVAYLATGPRPGPDDEAWAARVARHRGRRPAWWTTRESADLAGALAASGPPLLVDALGTWVAAVMDSAGAWHDAPGWREEVQAAVDDVVTAWRQTRRRVVAVGEEVGWGVVPAEPGVAAFREVLGGLARRLAEASEQVLLVVAGRAVPLGTVQAGAPA